MIVRLSRTGRHLTSQYPGKLEYAALIYPYYEDDPSGKTRVIGGMNPSEAMFAEVTYVEGRNKIFRVWDQEVWTAVQALARDGVTVDYYAVSDRKATKLGERPYLNTYDLMMRDAFID